MAVFLCCVPFQIHFAVVAVQHNNNEAHQAQRIKNRKIALLHGVAGGGGGLVAAGAAIGPSTSSYLFSFTLLGVSCDERRGDADSQRHCRGIGEPV
ncbi:uncharacterized protein SPSK_04721 [Sporothrix schenckii 1099-18]|uniref:Uncharacterized protein n=1 Tax=Sporothrix schenckii 1099-18 TaxID=1397361 RepID=A0A0F2M002_SPOSC|nr:uncharacterized protein SPSK_04721 [Sporothrix schenckii 1099-18]KJR83027.1 hypothetical protein SPSK_04721 [Sporothrix schenckii 1099-18]